MTFDVDNWACGELESGNVANLRLRITRRIPEVSREVSCFRNITD